MVKPRLLNTVLIMGFAAYLLMCIGVQIVLFKHFASGFQGIGHTNIVPFATLAGSLDVGISGSRIPLLMWIQLAVLMIPFGSCLFLWVEDCTSFRSIALITLGFSGVTCGLNYVLVAPLFDIDFMVSSLCGAFLGYGIAVFLVKLVFANRIGPMLNTPARRIRKTG